MKEELNKFLAMFIPLKLQINQQEMAFPRAWCGGCCRRPSSAHMYLPIFVVNLVIAVSVPGLFTLESSYFSSTEMGWWLCGSCG